MSTFAKCEKLLAEIQSFYNCGFECWPVDKCIVSGEKKVVVCQFRQYDPTNGWERTSWLQYDDAEKVLTTLLGDVINSKSFAEIYSKVTNVLGENKPKISLWERTMAQAPL